MSQDRSGKCVSFASCCVPCPSVMWTEGLVSGLSLSPRDLLELTSPSSSCLLTPPEAVVPRRCLTAQRGQFGGGPFPVLQKLLNRRQKRNWTRWKEGCWFESCFEGSWVSWVPFLGCMSAPGWQRSSHMRGVSCQEAQLLLRGGFSYQVNILLMASLLQCA